MASIKQIVNFQLKVLRMAGFVEFVQQVTKLVKDFRDSGEEGQSQLPTKVEPVYTSFKDSVTAVDRSPTRMTVATIFSGSWSTC